MPKQSVLPEDPYPSTPRGARPPAFDIKLKSRVITCKDSLEMLDICMQLVQQAMSEVKSAFMYSDTKGGTAYQVNQGTIAWIAGQMLDWIAVEIWLQFKSGAAFEKRVYNLYPIVQNMFLNLRLSQAKSREKALIIPRPRTTRSKKSALALIRIPHK